MKKEIKAKRLDLQIWEQVSPDAERCSRCQDLGLPHAKIYPGETHYAFISDGKAILICCEDCWLRLCEEIDSMESNA